LEGRNSKAEHLKRCKEKLKGTERRKEDEDDPDDTKYIAGKN
jgi:hypothetical protein